MIYMYLIYNSDDNMYCLKVSYYYLLFYLLIFNVYRNFYLDKLVFVVF